MPAVAVGATAWCALHIGIGAAAGEAARRIEDAVGTGSWVLLSAIAVTAISVALVRRRTGRSRGTRT